jgi:hypothetical protein
MANYYVRPNGVDTNTGTSNTDGGAFKTLSHACTHATSSGDNIYVTAGTYNGQNAQCVLATGVNIIGDGMSTTILECTYNASGAPFIKAETNNGWLNNGVYGNQSISGIRFDGNMTTSQAIDVMYRSNVWVHDCTIIDFINHGVQFVGMPDTGTSYGGGQIPWDNDPNEGTFPDYWLGGNKLYNCVITNCAIYSTYGNGNVRIGTQDGIQIYGNTITQTARAAGSNGYGIKYYGRGFNKGTKCYNNTITIAPQVEGGYNFSLELWYEMEECEYYGNRITGCIDLDACDKHGGAYASWFHDNVIGFDTQQDHQEFGFDIEAYQTGLIINNNIIKNVSTGINFSFIWPIGTHPGDSYYDDIHIYDNLIYGIGLNGTGWTDGGIYGIGWNSTRPQDDATNVYIYNNTIVASGNYHSGGTYPTYYVAGIRLSSEGLSANNIQIKNNIITGFAYGAYASPVWLNSTVTGVVNLKVNYNVFYGNGNSNGIRPSGVSLGTGYSWTNNITTNPLLVSATDLHLQSTSSPAYHAGTATGLQSSSDYGYNSWYSTPSIGAYEYGSSTTVPTLTTTSITSITVSTASSGGNISSDGGSAVTARGVCWSISSSPTTANGKTTNGTGTGSFTSSITGLNASTLYYVRAYATNGVGTSYGSEVSFTTSAATVVYMVVNGGIQVIDNSLIVLNTQ